MSLGNNLIQARKKSGFSQEEAADNLQISRQTLSKWETDETIPNVVQIKKLAILYKMTVDDLIDFDLKCSEIKEMINSTDEETISKIDWTDAWAKKYPILVKYKHKTDISLFSSKLSVLLDELKHEYSFNETEAFLVLKDILYQLYKSRNN